ncbi:MAG: hypothetical protein V4613_14505 [Bacteroidota bacterium]
MKQLFFISAVLISLASCMTVKQKSNIQGRTDEVYFTPSDTRIIVYGSSESGNNKAPSIAQQSTEKRTPDNYSGSYSNRLRYFGSSSRFSYNNYQPTLIPTLTYNPFTGWQAGFTYGYYGSGFNSPFSPYYGCSMPYTDPFYTYGWGGNWMNYNPYYTYNPYMFNYNPYSYYGYGSYGCGGYGYGGMYYNNYNQYANSNTTGTGTNYGRRTGTTSPSTNTQTSGYRTTGSGNNSSTNTGTNNNGSNNSGSNSGSGWWNSSGSSNSGSGSTGGRSSGSSGGNTNTSTRRR